MSNITCCYNCEQRTLGCHATCIRYIKEKEDHINKKEKEHKDNELKYILNGLHDKRMNSDRPGKSRNRIR